MNLKVATYNISHCQDYSVNFNDDAPVNINGYRPTNWYGYYYGYVTAREAINQSMNILRKLML